MTNYFQRSVEVFNGWARQDLLGNFYSVLNQKSYWGIKNSFILPLP